MSFLNTVVDKVYVINMDKDTERLAKFDAQMRQHNISYTRVPGIVGADLGYHEALSGFCNQFCTAGMKGCALSHRAIWEDMLKNRYENVAIFEDDAILDADFNTKFRQGWEQLPNDYDIYYLGCDTFCNNTDISPKVFNKIFQTEPELMDTNLMSVSGSMGTHCYIISEKCAKTILDAPVNGHIDLQLIKWTSDFDLNAYSVSPVIVRVVETGDSNISENFPRLFNTLVRPVYLIPSRPLDWILGENQFQIGPYPFNILLIILSILICVLPYKYCFGILIWIIIEGIYAADIKNTSKYIQVLGGLFLIRWFVQRQFK
jgi:GR25 family glycosyltransferase involved in LPS biosynthesis